MKIAISLCSISISNLKLNIFLLINRKESLKWDTLVSLRYLITG